MYKYRREWSIPIIINPSKASLDNSIINTLETVNISLGTLINKEYPSLSPRLDLFSTTSNG